MVGIQSNSRFLSVPMQRFLLTCYESKIPLTFKGQSIYKNQNAFNRAVAMLIKARMIKSKKAIYEGGIVNVYELTLNGKFAVEEVIRDFIECNKR